jgi:nucleotidyltransferase substrate binding protein (TIGR01987 family)
VKIDYSPFEKAIAQLEKSKGFYHSKMAEENDDLKEQFRAAVIQAFEYTYELAYKMIRRQLAQIVSNPAELKEMSFMDLIRTGKEAGLVREAPDYREYREKRNITSHTYDEDKALEIIAVIDSFLQEMRFLLYELKKRNGSDHEVD